MTSPLCPRSTAGTGVRSDDSGAVYWEKMCEVQPDAGVAQSESQSGLLGGVGNGALVVNMRSFGSKSVNKDKSMSWAAM